MIRAVIFDLDDTLYDQKVYLEGAFRAVGRFVGPKIGRSPEEVARTLLETARRRGSGSGRIIDEGLAVYGEQAEAVVGEAIQAFISYRPELLELYEDAKRILVDLRSRGIKIGIITDGRPEIQNAKIGALGLMGRLDALVITDEYGRDKRKPSHFAYELVLERLGVRPPEAVFVGDNPHKDFVAPRRMGMPTVRLLRGEYRGVMLDEEREADYSIVNLSELAGFLGGERRASLHRYYEHIGATETIVDTYESRLPSKMFFFRERFKAVMRASRGFGGTILDLGSGIGLYSATLRGRCVAVDLSRTFLHKARETVEETGRLSEVDFVQADAQALPFRDGGFDSVLCTEVIEHLISPANAVREIARVARPGARVVLTIPSPYSFAELERRGRKTRDGGFNDHISVLSPFDFQKLVKRNGFSVMAKSSTFLFPPLVPVSFLNRYPRVMVLFGCQRLIGKLPLLRYLGWTLIYRLRKECP